MASLVAVGSSWGRRKEKIEKEKKTQKKEKENKRKRERIKKKEFFTNLPLRTSDLFG